MKKVAWIALVVVLCLISACSGGQKPAQNDRYVIFRAKDKSAADFEQKMDETRTVLENRLRAKDAKSAVVLRTDDTLRVEIPSEALPYVKFSAIGKAARLEILDPSGAVIVSNTNIVHAAQKKSSNLFTVDIQLDSNGTKAFANATEQLIGQAVSIRINGAVVSQPTINTAITSGEFFIENNFTEQQAQELAAQLEIGSLALELDCVDSGIIQPQKMP